MKTKLIAIVLGLSVWGIPSSVSAEDSKAPACVTSTERMNFAPGGTIHLNNSYGYLIVEGWDKPEVEITTIKSTENAYEPGREERATRHLSSLHIVVERRSDSELAITTTLPTHRGFFPPLVRRKNNDGMTVDYRIHVPRDSQLVIHHDQGYVLVSNVTGDIEATSHKGDIVLMLPDSNSYSINARSSIGIISSDFTGVTHRQHFTGERYFLSSAAPSRRINLKIGFGGITIKQVPADGKTDLKVSLTTS